MLCTDEPQSGRIYPFAASTYFRFSLKNTTTNKNKKFSKSTPRSMCSLLVNENIVNMYTWTFFKKGLLAFKTTLKISPVSTFHWKKKKKQRVCNINKLLYNKQYTRRHHIGGVFFFSTGRNGQNSQTESAMGQVQGKDSVTAWWSSCIHEEVHFLYSNSNISVPYR